MAGGLRLPAVLCLLVATSRSAEAAANWADPFVTAEVDKDFIKAFDQGNALITLYEDIPVGYKLCTLHIDTQGAVVSVTQRDPSNAELQLEFSGTGDTVYVLTKTALDYEKGYGTLNVGVLLDGGNENNIAIKVLDVNDNPPIFEGGVSQINLDVPENQKDNSLLTLSATDGDTGATATLTYALDTEYTDTFKLLTNPGAAPSCELQLLQPLDYEARQLYKLTITAQDTPDDRGNTQTSSVTVFVNVVDAGDTPPRWLKPAPTTSKDECLAAGAELFTVEAMDGDTMVDNPVVYSIISQVPDGMAKIFKDNGTVTLLKELDREADDIKAGYITIVVQAREAPGSDPDQPCSSITCVNGTALITVNDLDDNPPVLDKASYAIEVPENTNGALGLTITVTDKDPVPPNGLIVLSVEDAPQGSEFTFSKPSGPSPLTTDIQVPKGYLDYEKADRRTIKFKVVATGDNVKKLSASSEVTITVTDVNDETPEFKEPSYPANVKEDAAAGTVVVTAAATDDDSSSDDYGTNSIRYSLSGGGSLRDAIAIDSQTGEVTLASDAPFDFERGIPEVKYTIIATDMKGDENGNTATVPLTITVVDVDDTPPVLTLPADGQVLEETEDTVTAEISGTDEDSSAKLDFSISWDDSTAKKSGNDVTPADYNFTRFFDIASTDGLSATLSTVNGGPDREEVDTVTLCVVVTDANTEAREPTDRAFITISILDQNDNPPFFTNVDKNTKFSINENSPPESLISPVILAKDIDQDNIITYSLDGDAAFTSLVTIGENTGQLSVKGTIDREVNPFINLTLVATDSGVPPQHTSLEISIEVGDQNDNRPEWVEDPNTRTDLTVMEGEEAAPVYTLTAMDKDKPGTPASAISYFLSDDGLRNFTVDRETGEVTVRGTLDREELAGQNYVLTVRVRAADQCNDQDQCVNTIDSLLSVKVLDANDCPPVFPERSSYLAEVAETTPAGSQLNLVKATDADEEGTPAAQLSYTLQEVKYVTSGCKRTDLFTVTTDTGNNQANIATSDDLQGCWGVYNLTLAATDGEKPFNKGTGVYQVHVKDVNDAPTIVSPPADFSFEIEENSYDDSGSFMPIVLDGKPLTVQATDPDIPDTDNSRVSYWLLSKSTNEDATKIFDVDSSSGQMFLKSQINRESEAGFVYQLVVEARDGGDGGGLAAETTIGVTVTDVDEFPPRFSDRYNNASSFEEERPVGDTFTVTSVAVDDDETDVIFYFLVGGAKDTFELVDSTSSPPQLRTKSRLNRESQASYQLILQTTSTNNYPGDVDHFDPADDALLSLTVNVKDINDVTPSFTRDRLMGGIAAGDPKSTIFTIETVDPDLNDVVTYSITSDFSANDASIANISQPFVLNAKTGELSLNFDVDTNMQGYFDFEVTAEDKKNHRNTTDPPVRIFIITEEDRVKFVFANQFSFVQAKQDEVADILSKTFSVEGAKYVASVESVLQCPSDPTCTNMITHFIDDAKTEPVGADLIINLQFTGDVSNTLITELGKIQLNLTAIGDTTVKPTEDDDTVFQMLLIVVASVLGGILALTLITSCIHTAKLRRQVKALSINAFGSKESGLQHAGLAVPGSNMYANQGANPIFSMDDKRPTDAESVSSGDSVLIGVEDDPEFATNSTRPGQKRRAPSAPPLEHDNPAFQGDVDADDALPVGGPAVFDENSRHHMPSFAVDDDGDAGTSSPFDGGVTQNPLFGAGDGGATQNPLFGAEVADREDAGDLF